MTNARSLRCFLVRLALLAAMTADVAGAAAGQDSIRTAQQKVVKLYGAGGLGRIEGYGTGVLVSPDGHILSVLSPLLESAPLRIVLANGRRYEANLLAVDSLNQLVVLKIDELGLDHFELRSDVAATPGSPAFALSNCFGIAQGAESASVQRAHVAIVTRLKARQGFFRFSYPGEVVILDAVTNNPGAAGGALVSEDGRFLGLLGKEVQNEANQTWVNYAIPASTCHDFVTAVLKGEFKSPSRPDRSAPVLTLRADLRGIVPLPDVLDKTPAFVDRIKPDSAAQKAGLQPDDLILFVGDELVQSIRDLNAAMDQVPANETVKIVVLRGEDLLTLELGPVDAKTP